MRSFRCAVWVVGAAWAVSFGLTAGWAQDSFPIKVYPTPKAAVALSLDGKLDDPAWQGAPLVSGFTNYGQDKLAKVQTSFRVLWDDKYLYFGVHCDEPQMDKVNPVIFGRDEHPLFSNETIELFVDPTGKHDMYYQLACSVSGSLFDGKRDDVTWNSHAVVKTFSGSDYWSLEVAIPWADLEVKPHAGALVGFNVCRDRNIGEREWTNWARVMTGFHDSIRFAHLVLSGTPEMIGKLGPELRRGNRRGAIEIYSAEGLAAKSYRQLAAAELAQMEKMLADLDQTRHRETNPHIVAEMDKRLKAFREQIPAFRQQAQGELDGASWTRLDLAMQDLMTQLGRVLWDARLAGLLDSL
jgi:hypothetical protein